MAMGNVAYKILLNIILGKIKPYFEKVMGDSQNGFRDGRSVIYSILWRTIRMDLEMEDL
jgi:hypothetical protein